MIYLEIFIAIILSIYASLLFNLKIVFFDVFQLASFGILYFSLIMRNILFKIQVPIWLVCTLLVCFSFIIKKSELFFGVFISDEDKELIYDKIKKNNIEGLVELDLDIKGYGIRFLNCPIKKKIIFIKDIYILLFRINKSEMFSFILYFIVCLIHIISGILGFYVVALIAGVFLLITIRFFITKRYS